MMLSSSNHDDTPGRSRRVANSWRMRKRSIILLTAWLGGYLLLLSSVVMWQSTIRKIPLPLSLGTWIWAVAQWVPHSQWSRYLSEVAWKSFAALEEDDDSWKHNIPPLSIPTLDLRNDDTIRADPLQYLLDTYGDDWRDRPLWIQGLWSSEELQNPTRRLSIQGLEQESLMVHYFSNARQLALSPDSQAPLSQIIQGMQQGKPYKIGSQDYIQTYPDRLKEVAPLDTVRKLFGDDRFTKDRLLGHITSLLAMFQGPLTVPIFAANANAGKAPPPSSKNENECADTESCEASSNATSKQGRPFTGLHCEPIGNVAVQLAGARRWTLVQPEHWRRLQPTVAPDGRGFFASWIPSLQHVPRYSVVTLPGDAVWVPPWTWHQVDYVVEKAQDDDTSAGMALGASLFHFRPIDFMRRHPLYALLLAPYLVGELVGSKTQ